MVIIYKLEVIDVEDHSRDSSTVLLLGVYGIHKLCLDTSVVKYISKRIHGSHLFIFLKSGHKLYCILVDILYHEHETVVVIVVGLGTAEDELNPDIFSFKVHHETVER